MTKPFPVGTRVRDRATGRRQGVVIYVYADPELDGIVAVRWGDTITPGRLCGKAKASDAGNGVVLAYARTPR